MARSRSSFTRKKGETALNVLREKKGAAAAAAAIGVTRQTLYNWRDEQPEFAAEWDAIQESITDQIEKSAIERAIEGDTTLAIFMLKSRRRDTYAERVQHTGPNDGPIAIKAIHVPKPGDES